MDNIINKIVDSGLAYKYNAEDKVITINSIELCLTTKGNIGVFDKNNYIATLPVDKALSIL